MSIQRTRYLSCVAPLALAAFAGWNPAWAQGTESGRSAGKSSRWIEEIIVTAQKREERLQDVPIAITALSGEGLKMQNIKSVEDFRKLAVPGLVSSQQTGSPIIGMTIRGISTQDQQPATLETPIALYIDGVYVPRTEGLSGNLFEVERVEVLRGPQGTLFGRNAEGGAVSIVSKKPTGEFGGSVGTAFGDYGARSNYVHLNLPAVGNVSIKLDGYTERLGGWTDNGPAGSNPTLSEQRDFGERDNWGVHAALLWEPSDRFSALLSADHSELKNAPTYQHFDAPTALYSVIEVNDYVKESPITFYRPYEETKVRSESLVMTYEITDDVTIKSISAHREMPDDFGGTTNLQFFSTFPFGAGLRASGIFAAAEVTSESVSQEVQLIGTADEFEYTVGVFYFREKATDSRWNLVTVLAPDGAEPFSVEPIDLGGRNYQRVESEAFAIFGQTTWSPASFDDKLKITLGGRYTEDVKRGERLMLNNVLLETPIRPDPVREHRFDPALTVAYWITPDVNVYARYAQAFRVGGNTVRDPNFSGFGSEENQQVELGLKSELFDGRLRFNAAAFYTWVSDQQINVIPPDDPTIQVIINVSGTTKLYGAEFEAVWAPLTGLTLGASAATIDGKQPDYDCSGCDRKTITYTPDWQLGANLDYERRVANFADGYFHVDYKYTSNFHTSPKALPGEVWPPSSADVMNARLGLREIELGAMKANISVYVENIFDNDNVVFDTNVSFQTLQDPRHYGVEVSVDF